MRWRRNPPVTALARWERKWCAGRLHMVPAGDDFKHVYGFNDECACGVEEHPVGTTGLVLALHAPVWDGDQPAVTTEPDGKGTE